ncbi:MAG: 16S rRNA (guanine(966)-N(2))-methyltransferase RsmD [Clostridiales bacterium]|nr:16S rRNA (guanine(966)-N(2))-methyltransferase RsmD [Clostridiales bacterium]
MRIIAGELKGRRLKSPKDRTVRPTKEKIKEAVFSILLPYLDEGFVCMDLFTGSGNLGLEAISRGAKTVYFSDASKECLALAKENINHCRVADRAVLLLGDYRNNIRRVRENVDIFLVDPPYGEDIIVDCLRCIDEAGICSKGGLLVAEHGKREQLPQEAHGFVLIKEKKYGASRISIYERK